MTKRTNLTDERRTAINKVLPKALLTRFYDTYKRKRLACANTKLNEK